MNKFRFVMKCFILFMSLISLSLPLTSASGRVEKDTSESHAGDVSSTGSITKPPSESITPPLPSNGEGGDTKRKVTAQIYPVRIHQISKPQANYKTPENTIMASESALKQRDLDWYYQSFTVETAAQDKKMFQDSGIDPAEKFKLALGDGEMEFITNKISYKDGIVLIVERRGNDIDGTIIKAGAGLVLEDDLWKVTYKFSQDEEFQKYNDVVYTNCIASFRCSLRDVFEDSCWHGNDLTNYNQTDVTIDKRYDEDLAVAVFNGINNGLGRELLNDMPREEFSMGGWIKAEAINHNSRIIEIGRNRDDSCAIVMDPGNGLRYWVHVDGRRVERTAAMDYDFHDNQWHHVYLTYDGAVMKLYVDGQLKNRNPVTGAIDSAPMLNIGQRNALVNAGTADAFKGRIDDIQLYNKALTAEQISKKFNNGTTQPL